MLDKNDLEKIKETAKDFFKKMTFEVEIETLSQKEPDSFSEEGEGNASTIYLNLKTENPQILIGERGQTLLEIQHLLKAILRRKIKEPFFIDLDIEGYKKKKIEYLKEMAFSFADEVALNKKEKWLPYLSSYERRIIHLELAKREDVVTESSGEGPERKLVIRPRP